MLTRVIAYCICSDQTQGKCKIIIASRPTTAVAVPSSPFVMTGFINVAFSVTSRGLSTAEISSRTFVGASISQTRHNRACISLSRIIPYASAATQVSTKVENELRGKLRELYDSTPCMPIMVRLAWHDAGTYNKEDGTGGANGSIRFQPESGHAANAGLKKAMDFLEPIKQSFPEVGYADLYQLASVVAIEYAGGPKIPFRFGRKDATEQETTPDGRLPDGDKRMGHLRDIFYRMGFNDKEITLLSGAHTLGRAHKERSGFEGPWTHEPVIFDNTYYKEILKEDPDPDLLRLESDLALLDQPETRALVEKYAEDQNAFFKDYSDAHVKLSELGAF